MECRPNCGMCCIAPSITQALPGMPDGKPAGVLCANIDPNTFACRIWGTDDYPNFCRGFLPDQDFCGNDRKQAEQILTFLEGSTKPASPS